MRKLSYLGKNIETKSELTIKQKVGKYLGIQIIKKVFHLLNKYLELFFFLNLRAEKLFVKLPENNTTL